MTGLGRTFVEASIETFRSTRSLGTRALEQVRHDEDLHRTPLHDGNSISVVVTHMHGNMLSRWTDFLTSDGEKPWRVRDEEFVDDRPTKSEVMRRWNEGWDTVLGAVGALADDDLSRTVTIRGEPLSVPRAIMRQIEHYGYHTGQIVSLCKHVVGEGWATLTVERGASDAHNRSYGYDPRGGG